MSIIDPQIQTALQAANEKAAKGGVEAYKEFQPSVYTPSKEEAEARAEIVKCFTLGYTTMYYPRVEFNDLSTIARDQIDFLAFNTYQPNNGDPLPGDSVNSWKSNAVRPVERNKVISTAGHAAGRLGFLKQSAISPGSEVQEDGAQVMNNLLDYVRANYFDDLFFLNAVLQAEVAPAVIIHEEYRQTYKKVVKETKKNGKYTTESVIDEEMSGFLPTVVPVDQFYIENFFEADIQKQAWLIWRRVQSHDLLEQKYGHLPNWKHVMPSMHLTYNDANQGFYYVYDPNMRQYMGEEIIFWKRATNRHPALRLVMVNGILLSEPDAPNPREDGKYPFAKSGYETIRVPCFYYKSLVFKVSHDANIVNSLYPMIIDGTYLDLMQPMVATGAEIIGSEVIVPGMVTTLSSADAQLRPIRAATNLNSGMAAMQEVEKSLSQTSDVEVVPQGRASQMTAYEISVREQQRDEALGPFRTMLLSLSAQLTELVRGDILQYLTVADADQITDKPELVYKSFLTHSNSPGGSKYSKVKFETGFGTDELEESYKTLEEQGGVDSDMTLLRADPEALRKMKFTSMLSTDALRPRSEQASRMFDLETYDRAIANPIIDQTEATKAFLLATNEKSARNPDKFISKVAGQAGMGGPLAGLMGAMGQGSPMGQPQGQPQGMPQAAPANQMSKAV
jgi:hypothetical protein